MKKPIIITFTLCCCLFLYNPVKQLIFAEPSENTTTTEQNTITVEKDSTTAEQDTTAVEKNTTTAEQDTAAVEKNTTTVEQDTTAIEKNNTATVEQDTTAVEQNAITQEQAKELLVKYNNKVNYVYQGDENNFEALKAKGLHGYVFLPDVDTDIGYFVDKYSSQIYFFHPSGYLELVK